MSLKDDLQSDVKTIFRSQWTIRDGTVVPADTSLKLSNDAVRLNATVLYADLADSTKLVDRKKDTFVAEVYKTYLYCAGKIISAERGDITAYDGDRVMAVYIDERMNTRAVRTAMKLHWAVEEIIQPALKAQYSGSDYVLKHVVGIDTSKLFVAKTGIRGSNDLVWVGRAANYAAKLAALPESFAQYITKEVYDELALDGKESGGKNMWEAVHWNTFDDRIIYRSDWRWPIE